MLPGLLALFWTGCAKEPDPTEPTGLPADTGTPETSEPSGGTEPPPSPLLLLTLADTSGAPLSDALVHFGHSTVFRTVRTDLLGTALFEDVDPGLQLVLAQPEGLASPFVPLHFEEGERLGLTLYAPALEWQPLQAGPALYTFGSLQLQVEADALTIPPFQEPPTQIGAARLDPSLWPPLEGVEGEVLALWMIEPFDHRAPEGVPLRITESLGLAAGEQARVWVGSNEALDWVDAGVLVSDGASLAGAALPALSTVVIARD